MKATWRDWVSSRIIRLQLYIGTLLAGFLLATSTMTAADWAAIGLDQTWANRVVMTLAVIGNFRTMILRADTTGPLAGRADK